MRTERDDLPGGRLPWPSRETPARRSPASRRWLMLAAGLAVGLSPLAPATALGQKKPPPPPPGEPSTQSSGERTPGLRYSGRLMIGDAGPDFSLATADGATFRLRSLRDREGAAVVFLQRAEMLLAGYAKMGDSLRAQGIRLVFACQQRLPKEEKGWPGIVLAHDRQGDVARVYGALDVVSGDTVPAVYLLDAKGKLRYYAVGRLPNPGELQAISVAVLAPTSPE